MKIKLNPNKERSERLIKAVKNNDHTYNIRQHSLLTYL